MTALYQIRGEQSVLGAGAVKVLSRVLSAAVRVLSRVLRVLSAAVRVLSRAAMLTPAALARSVRAAAGMSRSLGPVLGTR